MAARGTVHPPLGAPPTAADAPPCPIQRPWLRRVGLIGLLFYLLKGLFWMGLWWWLG